MLWYLFPAHGTHLFHFLFAKSISQPQGACPRLQRETGKILHETGNLAVF